MYGSCGTTRAISAVAELLVKTYISALAWTTRLDVDLSESACSTFYSKSSTICTSLNLLRQQNFNDNPYFPVLLHTIC